MDWRIEEGCRMPDTVRELFAEYTKMLEDSDSKIRECLRLQNYDDELADLEYKYGRPWGRLFVVFQGEKPAGCIGLRKMDEERCEMKRLYVRPAFRGQKLGEYLAKLILEEGKAQGYRYMMLDTLTYLRSAVKLYEKLGFYEIERYNDNPMDEALYLQKDL